MDDLLPCEPVDGETALCATRFIASFGQRAFRRPLKADEVSRYLELWYQVGSADGFDAGVRWVITAMLQSPHFLYRSELRTEVGSGSYTLSDWEVASGLSYLLWGTMPDDPLFQAAADGALHTPEQIQAQVERMREDPRFLETAADFVQAWLHLERLQTVSREGLTQELRQSMAAETRALSREIAWVDGSLRELMELPVSKMDEVLAAHHGIDNPGWVDLDGRRDLGLLGQASVGTTYALPTGSSPVHRGAMVRRYLLCQELTIPPPEVQAAPPEKTEDTSTRDRYAEHMSKPECSVCHDMIDPIGFGFEHYDQLGRWRDTDDGHPVDGSGRVDKAAFDGVNGLIQTLLDDERFRTCFVWTWRRWKLGAEVCAEDPGELRFTGPLLEMAAGAALFERAGGVDEGDTLAVEQALSWEALAELSTVVGESVEPDPEPEPEYSCVDLPDGESDEGFEVNTRHCQDCHEENFWDSFRPIPDDLGEDDEVICQTILNGNEDMPPIALAWEDIAHVIAYLRELQTLGD